MPEDVGSPDARGRPGSSRPAPSGRHALGRHVLFQSRVPPRHALCLRPDAPKISRRSVSKGSTPNSNTGLGVRTPRCRREFETGAELMTEGLPIALAHAYSSDLIYLQEASQGTPRRLEPHMRNYPQVEPKTQ